MHELHPYTNRMRVAPIEVISSPKLQLCVAVLLAKMDDFFDNVKRANPTPNEFLEGFFDSFGMAQ